MRKYVIVFYLLGFVAFSSAIAQTWLSGPLEDALAKAKSQGKMVLVDFFSPG
jgi:hypothetical protein